MMVVVNLKPTKDCDIYFHWMTSNQINFNEAWKHSNAYSLDYFLKRGSTADEEEEMEKLKQIFNPSFILQSDSVFTIYSRIRQSVFAPNCWIYINNKKEITKKNSKLLKALK